MRCLSEQIFDKKKKNALNVNIGVSLFDRKGEVNTYIDVDVVSNSNGLFVKS